MELLETLATAAQADKRRDLLRHVASLFLLAEKEGLEHNQVQLFGQVMSGLLRKASLGERVDVSTRLADSANAPRELVVTMATDEITVAGPVLERSPVLDEDDLIRISQGSDGAHRLAVSKRADLSGRVTDELISHHETDVMRTITANESAEITQRGFTAIATRSAEDEELRQRLVSRPDMPFEIARDVLPMLGADERQALLDMLERRGGEFEELVAQAKAQTSQLKIVESKRRLQAKAFANEIALGLAKIDEVVDTLSAERRPHCLAFVLSRLSNLPEKQTYHAILGTSGQLLALICRANGVSHAAFLKADEMRRDLRHLPQGVNIVEKDAYIGLDINEAGRAMRFAKAVNRAQSV